MPTDIPLISTKVFVEDEVTQRVGFSCTWTEELLPADTLVEQAEPFNAGTRSGRLFTTDQ